jgi:hypothetical protein
VPANALFAQLNGLVYPALSHEGVGDVAERQRIRILLQQNLQ